MLVDPFADFQSLGDGETGTAIFSYTVEDDFGGQSTGNVETTINGINDLPVAVQDGYTVVVSDFGSSGIPPTQSTFNFGDIRANDIDPDDSTTELVTALGPNSVAVGGSQLGATVSVSPDGTLFYDARGLNVGRSDVLFDYIDYTVTDASGEFDDVIEMDGGFASNSIGGIAMLVVGPDAEFGFAISDTSLTVQELTQFSSFDVALTVAPTEDITFTISSSDATEAVTDVTTLTFTPDNWFTPQTVVVQSVDDQIVDGTQNATISVAVQDNTDLIYGDLQTPIRTVDVTALDNQIPRILTTRPFVLVQEGGFDGTVGVFLDEAPQGTVMVVVDEADQAGDYVALPTELTFTPDNFATPQFVTVVAIDDDLLDGPNFGILGLDVDPERTSDDYDNARGATVFAGVIDNEVLVNTSTISLAPAVIAFSSGLVVNEGDAGTTTTVEVTLARFGPFTDRATTVAYEVVGAGSTYAAAADDFFGGLLPSGTVTFAADEIEKTFSFAVSGDNLEELSEYYSINFTAVENAAITTTRLEGTIINDDGASGVTPANALAISLDDVIIAESETATATVTRTGDISEALTVTLASSDETLATVPSTVMIPVGASSATFTVTGVDDDVFNNEGLAFPSTLISASASGFKADGETMFVVDDDPNPGPDAVDDTATVSESGEVTIDYLANDTDSDGDTVTVFGFNTAGLQGRFFETEDGKLTYFADGAFDELGDGETATDTFTYTITDGITFDTATVTITITGEGVAFVDADPVATDDAYETDADTPFRFGNVLDNDTDENVSTLRVPTINQSNLRGVVFNDTNGEFVYNPYDEFSGLGSGETATEIFTYTVEDENGNTDIGTVTITINGVGDSTNTDPVAVDDSGTGFATDEDTAITTASVLTNDSDTDGDTLSVFSFDTTATRGTVANLGNGTFSYNPAGQFESLNDGESDTDTFTYTISDGNGGTATATVTIGITGVGEGSGNMDPVAVDDAGTGFETDQDTAFTTGNVLDNDTDDDGDILTITTVDSSTTLGLVVDNGDGTFNYDPNGAFDSFGSGGTGTDTFTYTVSDGNGGTDTATVTVTVTGTNDAPTIDSVGATFVTETTDDSPIEGSRVVAFEDVDLTDEHTVTIAFNRVSQGVAPDLTDDELTELLTAGPVMQEDGSPARTFDYTFLAASTVFDYLAEGEKVTLNYTLTINDGNGGVLIRNPNVVVTGTDDGPVAVVANSHIEFDTTKLALVDGGKPNLAQIELQLGATLGGDDPGYDNQGTKALDDDTFAGVPLDEALASEADSPTLVASEIFFSGRKDVTDPDRSLEPYAFVAGVQDIGGFKTREGDLLNPRLENLADFGAFKLRADAEEAPDSFIFGGTRADDALDPDDPGVSIMKGGQDVILQGSGFGLQFGIDRNGNGKPDFGGDGGANKEIDGKELLLLTLEERLTGTDLSFGVARTPDGSADVALDFYTVDNGVYTRVGHRDLSVSEGASTGALGDLGFEFDAVAFSSADGDQFRLDRLEIATFDPLIGLSEGPATVDDPFGMA